MAVLEHLEPKGVFHFFEEMCAIPHGSSNTKQVSDWLMDFARERGLEACQDQLNNVIIIKEATPGYENVPAVILQGHMDMVCEKAPDCAKDMAREGLDLAVEGDTVYAQGTTLGGDDGIAVAMALAILDADDIPHPRLEAVFTVDEEIGMLGASGLDVSMLRGRRMVNLDSESEGVFTVSCAGGCITHCVLPIRREVSGGEILSITVGGLRGGHSGAEIDKGLGNANTLLGRVLYACSRETELRIVSVNGGLKDNAIPREAAAVVAAADAREVMAVCARLDEVLKQEYRATDPGVFVSAQAAVPEGAPMDADTTRRVLCFLTCAPNGIQAMSADIPGLVQTSLNLGILTTGIDSVSASFCVRSSLDSQKRMLVERLECLTAALGGAVSVSGDYSGWEYRKDSPLRELLTEVFTQQYGYAPKIEAFHGGVECGIFAGKLPGLDCVSLGPDLTEIHTCRERLHIASVQRLWAMLLETLKRMK
ncbi:aminoacyl-histidine dipeptidase [Pseudoflavonifractor phocaeensis]|uniref:aminoacyl-histidine dipeptidase n=1 Tax=Pseudoflavonifractor phocaeensis TaxID=1870988 RepID=UPI001F313271|nr:aminoacyl-histidine dipeptidase [Pseudoflavonifractor phocaeensis]MCF2661865.1 aminoacyl-histidine dipeptidase [Pseudoflavonifractor phocaeensis]